MAGSVIQATGIVEFGDGLWIGNHLKARNGPQWVCTVFGVQPGMVCTPRFLQERMNYNLLWSAWLLGVGPGARFDSG